MTLDTIHAILQVLSLPLIRHLLSYCYMCKVDLIIYYVYLYIYHHNHIWNHWIFICTGIPTQPSGVKAFNITSHSTNLTWLEPHNNNAPILNYIIKYMEPKFVGDDRNRVVNTTEEMVTISSLSPGVNYSFTVIAYNVIGPSLPSAPLIVKTLDEGKKTTV